MSGATLTQKPAAARVRSVAQLASEPVIAQILAWFASERKWITAKHFEVSRIAAPTFEEHRRAEWMAAQFKEMGFDTKIDKAGNVTAFVESANEGPFIAITAHLDTVLEPRAPEDIRIGRDGEMQGPGVSDNGAGLAALLAIGQAIHQHPVLLESPFPLVLIANVGEEGEGNLSGMRYLCRPSGVGLKTSAFIVLDGPATDHITYRALASRRFEIAVHGPGGHSWSDFGIGNPVHALSRAISMFCDNPAVANSGAPRTSFNFGTIEGGTSVNSIPCSARAKVDIRSESPARIDELGTLLTACLELAIETENDRASSGARLTAKIREIGSRPGGQLSEDAPVLAHLRAIDAHLGLRANLDCASTDANIPLSLGLQAVSIGAGGTGGGAHTPNEWYRPEGREAGLRRIFLALCLLMRDIDPQAALAG